MGNCTTTTPLCLLLLISLIAMHYGAQASQEAQLEEFIRSRRTRTGSNNNGDVHGPPFGTPSTFRFQAPVHLGSDEQSARKAADKIAALPGQPDGVDFDQYSGYVTVDDKNGRALFYYFAEAAGDAASKPLLLWLNGGPGCSSLGYGAMQELGPFRVSRDSRTLTRNKHAWNNVANVIFLESPAGVGFSYSNTSSDYSTPGDSMTAEDAYAFLLSWLERFPEYKARPFYVSGESYTGHYAPQLAAAILSHNAHGGNTTTTINLKGVLIGNPYLDDYKNKRGRHEFLWSHGVISDEAWADITSRCSFNSSDNDACDDALGEVDFGPIDNYNIYAPTCRGNHSGADHPSSNSSEYDPCSLVATEQYLNNPSVQDAFHARKTKWQDCRTFWVEWKDAPDNMVPTIKWLIDQGLPIWMFSGDFDSICPLTATRYSVRDLNLSITEPWRPWTVSGQVGGYVQQYKGGLTFASVRGAGHTVPSFQPERALQLLQSFLKGILPPYKMKWWCFYLGKSVFTC